MLIELYYRLLFANRKFKRDTHYSTKIEKSYSSITHIISISSCEQKSTWQMENPTQHWRILKNNNVNKKSMWPKIKNCPGDSIMLSTMIVWAISVVQIYHYFLYYKKKGKTMVNFNNRNYPCDHSWQHHAIV